MTVYRAHPLPRGTLRGQYRISSSLINDTQRALQEFFEVGRRDGGHEGLCFWAGRERADLTSLEAAIIPTTEHGRYGVFVSEIAFAEAARQARAMGLGILAQVHSHPSCDTRHSDGDDNLVIMPFENMLSLVAPYYGQILRAITDFSVHQFQDHRWVLCNYKSVLSAFETVLHDD